MPPRATARAALLTGLVLGAGLVPGVAHAAPGSTVTVTSCTESALRAAITDAPDGGTVQIACDDPILLTPGGGSTVVVDKTLTISGTGHDAVIDGGQQTSLFAVQAPAGATSPADLPIVTFRDLTLTRGWAQDTGSLGGGAIWSAGHIVVERVDFTDNHAFNRGGAILGLAFGSTTVVDSTFTGNSVTCPLDGSGGGAIAVRQRNATSITGSTFTGNSATGAASGGAVLAWVHEGYSGFPAEPPPFPPSPSPFATDLVITGSTFTDNRVTVGGSAALDLDRMYGGGALASFDHPLQVTDSLFEGNTVESIVGYGGAVFAASFRDTPTTLTTVDVLSNGFPDRVGQFVANGIGGGVALQGTPSTVDDTIIDGNRAFVGGGLYTRGAPVEVVDSSIDENTAGAVNPGASNHGGGLATRGPVTLTTSQLLGNLGGTCALFHPDAMTLPTGDVVIDGGANDIEGRASCFRPAVPPTSPPATGALTSPSAPTPPGDPVSLAGSGFAPHTRVTLVAYPLTVAAAAPGTAAAAPGAVDLGSAAADGAGLVIVSSVLPGAGVWRVLALGTSPSGTTVSLEAVVLVAAAGTDVAPAVVSQPASATGAVGTTVTLTATAAGSPAPTVQWQRSTDGSTWSDEPGATGTSLAVAVPAGSASYRAVFSNAAGTVVSAVAVVSGPAGAPGGGSGGGSGSGSGGGSGSGSTGGGADPVVDGSAAVPGVPGVAVGGAVLARTGADVLPVLATGAALVLAGALLVRFARRRRQEP